MENTSTSRTPEDIEGAVKLLIKSYGGLWTGGLTELAFKYKDTPRGVWTAPEGAE